MSLISLFLLNFSVSVFANSGVTSLVEFTSVERLEHRTQITNITQVAAQCLQATYDDHTQFFDQFNFSKYYGNRNPLYATGPLRFKAVRALRQFAKKSDQEIALLANQMQPTACITLVVQCLGQGFKAAGTATTWQKIYNHLAKENKFLGTDLQKILRDLGWKTYYWNPDPSQNTKWDEEDRRLNPLKDGRTWMPVWGGHAPHYNNVMKKGTYIGIAIDDKTSLVGFGQTQPAFFKKVQFFIGTAHAGYHVFPGFSGGVIEAHSMRKITARDNLEVSEFNPLGTGGGPRWTKTEKYRSGLIVIPPSF